MLVEFALVAVDRGRVERLADEGDRRAKIVAGLLGRLSFHLSGAQLGITITSLMLGFVAEPTVARILDPLVGALPFVPDTASLTVSIVVALALATVVQMVIGELVPKNWAIARPLELARACAPLHRWICVAFGPLIGFLNRSANWTVRRFGIEPREELRAVRTLDEFDLLVRSSTAEGTLDAADAELVSRSIRFRDKTAADILVPRTAVHAIEAEASVNDLFDLARRTRRTRFPVFSDSLDDIRGVVHLKDGYRTPPERRDSTTVRSIARDPLVVPASRDLRSLLTELRAGGSQLAVVIDEYGGTDGILTLEDVLEEIVGEIEDEHDPALPSGQARGPRSARTVAGTLHRDELEVETGFVMPEGPYETLAGFVLAQLGHIPVTGERVIHDGWTFTVRALERRRISEIEVRSPASGADTGPGSASGSGSATGSGAGSR